MCMQQLHIIAARALDYMDCTKKSTPTYVSSNKSIQLSTLHTRLRYADFIVEKCSYYPQQLPKILEAFHLNARSSSWPCISIAKLNEALLLQLFPCLFLSPCIWAHVGLGPVGHCPNDDGQCNRTPAAKHNHEVIHTWLLTGRAHRYPVSTRDGKAC
jgi:hypothetical protein